MPRKGKVKIDLVKVFGAAVALGLGVGAFFVPWSDLVPERQMTQEERIELTRTSQAQLHRQSYAGQLKQDLNYQERQLQGEIRDSERALNRLRSNIEHAETYKFWFGERKGSTQVIYVADGYEMRWGGLEINTDDFQRVIGTDGSEHELAEILSDITRDPETARYYGLNETAATSDDQPILIQMFNTNSHYGRDYIDIISTNPDEGYSVRLNDPAETGIDTRNNIIFISSDMSVEEYVTGLSADLDDLETVIALNQQSMNAIEEQNQEYRRLFRQMQNILMQEEPLEVALEQDLDITEEEFQAIIDGLPQIITLSAYQENPDAFETLIDTDAEIEGAETQSIETEGIETESVLNETSEDTTDSETPEANEAKDGASEPAPATSDAHQDVSFYTSPPSSFVIGVPVYA